MHMPAKKVRTSLPRCELSRLQPPKNFVCQEDECTRLPDRAFGPSIPLIAQIVPSSHGFSRQVGHPEEETWANFLGLGEHPPKL